MSFYSSSLLKSLHFRKNVVVLEGNENLWRAWGNCILVLLWHPITACSMEANCNQPFRTLLDFFVKYVHKGPLDISLDLFWPFLKCVILWQFQDCLNTFQKKAPFRKGQVFRPYNGLICLGMCHTQGGTVACQTFKFFFVRHKSFLWSHWHSCFGLLVTSALCFKARVDSLTHMLHHLCTNRFLRFTSGELMNF